MWGSEQRRHREKRKAEGKLTAAQRRVPCECGVTKIAKSAHCRACAMKLQAAQRSRTSRLKWSDPNYRERHRLGMLGLNKPRPLRLMRINLLGPSTRGRISKLRKRRRRQQFSDLSFASFRPLKKRQGRFRGIYWDDSAKYELFRYQWVWICANGPIPNGYVIHHKNEDPTDDRLENLECLTRSEHSKRHHPKGYLHPATLAANRARSK